jgi:glutamyl/glutaminyl-tRNA synthetase
MIVTLQSLYHGSDDYQHACTRVKLTKKAYPCKCNQEHKQEQERMQLNFLLNV